MAKLKYLGTAEAVSQVDEITLGGTWSAGESVRITINGRFVDYVAIGGDTAALVAAGLQAAAAASTAPEFEEITFTVATTKVTATGRREFPSLSRFPSPLQAAQSRHRPRSTRPAPTIGITRQIGRRERSQSIAMKYTSNSRTSRYATVFRRD